MKGMLSLAAIALAGAGAPLEAAYGETVTVEAKLNTVVSPGWVIIAQKSSGPQFHSPYFPTRHFLTLKNLNGAPLGAQEKRGFAFSSTPRTFKR